MMYSTLAVYISFSILVLAVISTITLFIVELSGVWPENRVRPIMVMIYVVLMAGMLALFGSIWLLEAMEAVC